MTTPTPDTAGITTAMVESHTGGMVPATTPRLNEAIAGCVGAIRRVVGWHVIAEREDTLTVDGNGERVILLRTGRIIDVTEVTEDEAELTFRDDYTWSADGWLTRKGGVWTCEDRGLAVKLTHGYNLDEVPELVGLILDSVGELVISPIGIPEKIGPFEIGQIQSRWLSGQRELIEYFRPGSSH